MSQSEGLSRSVEDYLNHLMPGLHRQIALMNIVQVENSGLIAMGFAEKPTRKPGQYPHWRGGK